MAELAVRTVFSLAVVIGLLLLLARVAGRPYRGGSGAVRVVQRQALSRGSAVTVVEIGRRTLVLGVTEQQVQVLAELDPGELEADAESAPRSRLSAVTPLAVQAPPAAPRAFAEHLLAEQAAVEPEQPGRHRAVPDRTPAPAGALAGSLLSPQTWRQGWHALARRAS